MVGRKIALIFLDTHAAVWLYAGDTNKFTDEGRNLINENDLFISPIVRLELQTLFEIERVSVGADSLLRDLQARIGLTVDDSNFNNIITIGLDENWTRDPFDRVIVAHAKNCECHLLTKDQNIKENYKKAVW